LSEKASEL